MVELSKRGEKLEENKTKKGTSFMKNVVILMCSQLLIKFLGLIYKLVITNIEGFGDTGVGYYSAGYQIYSLLLTLSSIGIPSVISKLVSERLATGDKKGAQRIFRVAMRFFSTLGLIFSFGLFFGADFIARNILNVPDTAYVMKVLAPAIVFVSISAVMRGYFAGQQNMKPTSVSQTLEQFLNCVLSITFVYACIGKDAYIMAAAGNLSTTMAIIITFVYLIMYYKRNKIVPEKGQVSSEEKKSDKQLLKTILMISIPITLSSIISVISSVIDTTTVSNCIQYAYRNAGMTKDQLETLAMSQTGILSKIDTLITFPLAINTAFSTALVPSISESIAKKENDIASKRLTFSVFVSILIILPCAMGFAVLANPILKMIYPTASDGAIILQISTISMIFTALNQTINGGLYGLNLPRVPVVALGLGVFTKTILNVVLVCNPAIGIKGAAMGSVACQILAFSICFTALNKKLKVKFDFKKNIFKPIIATVIMGICVFLAYSGIHKVVGNTISTLCSIIVGVVAYAVAIFGLRILSKEDIMMIPFGTKLYRILVKLHIYTDEVIEK